MQGKAEYGSQTPYVTLHEELSLCKEMFAKKMAKLDRIDGLVPYTLANYVFKADLQRMDVGESSMFAL